MKWQLVFIIVGIAFWQNTISQQSSAAETLEGILHTLSGALNLAKNLPRTVDSLRQSQRAQDADLVREITDVVLSTLNATSIAIGNLAASADVSGDSEMNN
ncbi:uncharacterized protein LOC129732440 [Wyeomyia smithii]|uniref:uncharacterized protein LOC129732440 n=1 Tax=Wyeomyia smithii TaxID=174621 RepID=UPI002467E2C8|nr:uncharacterized protein LOC129732440 [Wyeomyia smithii]